MAPPTRPRWSNWAGNQQASPASVHLPATEDELAGVVKGAAAEGEHVKVVGSGHSFTGAALTDGRMVRLDHYDRVLEVDKGTGRVTVEAGITLSALCEALDAEGLALENMGDIAYQTISGATATSTHGTGTRLGTLATQIRALRLVTGDGSVISCSEQEQPEVFAAARAGLGAMGAVSTVTLQTVPAFDLHAVEEPLRLDAVLEAIDDHADGADHFELYWVPHTGWALTKTNNRTDRPRAPRGRWQAFRDDVLLSNVAFGTLCRFGRLRPSAIPRLMRALPSTGRVEYVDRSDRVFTSPRYVHFYEMEYAIPRAHAADAVRAVQDYVKRSGLYISFPVEVRFVAADDIPLSTASGRDTCYIAVHVYRGMEYTQYFTAVESIMDELGGRPHWGKLHFQTAETLAPRYPQWGAFQAARRRTDPEGVFENDYTRRVLGPVSTG
ncbi:MAG TPA: D-arabinono-1,4-lactone oxidase [Acidimicrobiales bacterium]|nr:D-arabinono-1,4-lactone oxidase [Acidimicrobiales bacterium]